VSDALPEMIPLSEAFIQIWIRRKKIKKSESDTQMAEMAPPPPPPSAPAPSPKKPRLY